MQNYINGITGNEDKNENKAREDDDNNNKLSLFIFLFDVKLDWIKSVLSREIELM